MQRRRRTFQKFPPPSVKLSAAAPTARSLSFILTPENASAASYTCLPKGSALPDAAAVLGGGSEADPTAEGRYTVEGLSPLTEYVIVAAVKNAADSLASATLEMATLGLSPAVTLEAAGADKTSVSFILTPSEASEVSYVCVEKGSPLPDAAALLAEGTPAEASHPSEITLGGLVPGTAYTVAAAASDAGFLSEVATLDLSTVPMRPAVTLEAVSADERGVTFSLSPSEADRAAYICVEKGAEIPDAAALLAEGTAADPSNAKEYTVSGLAASSEYSIAAAAAWGETLSEVAVLEAATLESLYDALQGEWTATWKVVRQLGWTHEEPCTFTFDVTITDGINDATAALYRSANRLCCIGWEGWKVKYPDDLMSGSLDYWRQHPGEADWDWGPKWFLEFGEDGGITVPDTYTPYMEDGDRRWSILYYEFRYMFLGAANGDGEAFVGRPLRNVTVSPDRNTITIAGQVEEYSDGSGRTATVYPSLLMPKYDGATFFSIWDAATSSSATSLAVDDVVLTRKSPASAPSAPAPARTPTPAGKCIIR